MTGARLQEIYEGQLAEAPELRDEKGLDVAGFRVLLSVSRARGAVELNGEDGQVWVWSDLHLGDVDALMFFGRLFRSVDEMDDLLFERWRSSVGPDDSVLCLGDVGTWPSLARLQGLPGRKVLVFGNHDRSAKGFDIVCGSVYSHGDPPLLLTHAASAGSPAVCERARAPACREGEGLDGACQRVGRAAPLPAQAVDGPPTLGGGSRPRAGVAGPHDGPVAGAARRAGVRSRRWRIRR